MTSRGKALMAALVVMVAARTAAGQEAGPPSVARSEALDPALQRLVDEAVERALAQRLPAADATAAAPVPAPPPPPAALDDKFVESNVVSLVGREGFRWRDREGRFLLNPYVLVQTRLQVQKVVDAGLDLADKDNFVNLGFGIPNGILGIAGKAFGKLSFNLALNGACAGSGCLLNEAWLEGNVRDEFRVRVGKFKTPMHWNVQTRVGAKIAPFSPTSLLARVNLPADLNAVNPTMATGFDLGVLVHGTVADRFLYQVGIFNGEGVNVNLPSSNLSDDTKVPSLLYAARLAWMPFGAPPLEEGGPARPKDLRLLLAASASYNVEANAESSDDLRAGVELVLSAGGWYWATEAYLLHMDFMERLGGTPDFLFWGGYTLLAHSFAAGLEPFVRLDAFDRNSTREDGLLLMPGVGLNWYVLGQNLKLQALYQYMARIGHADRMAADDDVADLGVHAFSAQLQFAF